MKNAEDMIESVIQGDSPANTFSTRLQEAAAQYVGDWYNLLVHELTQWDRKQSKNIYSLGQLMGAGLRVQKDIDLDARDRDIATPEAIQTMLQSIHKHFESGFPPVVKWERLAKEYINNKKPPKLPSGYETLIGGTEAGELGSESPLPGWHKDLIMIAIRDGKVKAKAFVKDNLAVNSSGQGWNLTHIPTGMSFLSTRSAKAAMRAGNEVQQIFPTLKDKNTYQEVMDLVKPAMADYQKIQKKYKNK